MKSYWEIPGPSKAPHAPCIAFYKYDGSNLRFEYSKKQGWWKFGTRRRLFDKNDPEYSSAIPLFLETYADELTKIFKTNKNYRSIEKAVVFCEWFGPSSFAGWHEFNEEHELMLFDVEIHKKGFVLPRDFVNDFGHLKTAEVVYEGNFNKEFIDDVKNGKYPVEEGVVAKGVILGKKNNPQHGLWMSKIKTRSWMEKLKQKAEENSRFRLALQENINEQN